MNGSGLWVRIIYGELVQLDDAVGVVLPGGQSLRLDGHRRSERIVLAIATPTSSGVSHGSSVAQELREAASFSTSHAHSFIFLARGQTPYIEDWHMRLSD